MARRKFLDYQCVIICGIEFSRHGKTIRGPFKVLAKLASNGWADNVQIVAHVTSSGSVWHELVYRRFDEAEQAFEILRNKKGAMSPGEYFRRSRGGR